MARYSIVQPTYPNQEAQNVENHRALAAINELIANAMTAAENFRAYTESRLPPLKKESSALQSALDELYVRYRDENPAGWDEASMMTRCAQGVTQDQLKQICTRPTLDVEGVIHALRLLCTKDELPRGRVLVLKDNISALRAHDGPDATVDLPETLVALNEVQHVDITATIRDELAEMDAAKDKCATQVQEAEAAYDAAVARGELLEVERAHRHYIAALYEYVTCCAKRVHHLELSKEDEGVNGFAEQLRRLEQDAKDGLAHFKKEKESMAQALQEDIARCEKTHAEEEATHNSAAAAYAQAEQQAKKDLDALLQRKSDLIEELRRKAMELVEVTTQQEDAVRASIRAKAAEEKRVTAYREFVQLATQHKDRLARCLNYYNQCKPLVAEMEQYVKAMVEQLPQDEARETITRLTDDEADFFLEVYKRFVLVCGDLTVKKSHRLDTLERQARLTKHNRDSAMDSLDPNLENYRSELQALVEQMKAVEGVLNALNATQEAGEQVFESVEEPVRDMCDRRKRVFVHPLQELGIKSVDERNRFVDRSMKYVEGEEREIQHKRGQLAEMKAVAEQMGNAQLTNGHAADERPAAIEQ